MIHGEHERIFYAELGKLIFAARKQGRMSRCALAREIGVHRNTLRRWELGEEGTPLWMLLRIADAVGLNHLMLLPGNEYTWGAGYSLPPRAHTHKLDVQTERDPPIGRNEYWRLRRGRTA